MCHVVTLGSGTHGRHDNDQTIRDTTSRPMPLDPQTLNPQPSTLVCPWNIFRRIFDWSPMPRRSTHPPAPPQPSSRAACAAALRDRILTGALRPGALLSPAELASALHGSATPAREALIELTLEGRVESRPALGFRVRELTVREAQELYPLIWTLEGLALRSAPPSAALL